MGTGNVHPAFPYSLQTAEVRTADQHLLNQLTSQTKFILHRKCLYLPAVSPVRRRNLSQLYHDSQMHTKFGRRISSTFVKRPPATFSEVIIEAPKPVAVLAAVPRCSPLYLGVSLLPTNTSCAGRGRSSLYLPRPLFTLRRRPPATAFNPASDIAISGQFARTGFNPLLISYLPANFSRRCRSKNEGRHLGRMFCGTAPRPFSSPHPQLARPFLILPSIPVLRAGLGFSDLPPKKYTENPFADAFRAVWPVRYFPIVFSRFQRK